MDVVADKLKGEMMDLMHGQSFTKTFEIQASTGKPHSAELVFCSLLYSFTGNMNRLIMIFAVKTQVYFSKYYFLFSSVFSQFILYLMLQLQVSMFFFDLISLSILIPIYLFTWMDVTFSYNS